ncbi:hypothetical protein KSF_045560 [Reticulibacter mediterranei]|uniref:Glycosyltransferase RgtA/B/C/D-like domain-containing protein n=1 Tax=Reticulibacter mediterranei TaxID=2778369 RepID=A0A8J3N3M2_9CHLR|nr:hypothetical protein [Reticulibacter mediterranei]GHO94508.1 hypothetical protein KSF_045560 [Reticulibacter mediterranei]
MNIKKIYSKKLRIGRYELALLALVVGATLLRLLLLSLNWPVTNSDEATMGLMAGHIAYKHENTTFFYGQYYMGSMEAYLGAVFFRLFGPSTFTLRLGLLLLFALFLVTLYALTSLLYTKKFALAIVALFCFGSNDIILHQLKAIGGYPEIIFLGALILLLVALLSIFPLQEASKALFRRRLLLYVALGVVMGFALWTDSLILPILATSGLTLLVFCRRDLFGWGGLCLLLGLCIGGMPLIIYNITAPYGQTSFNALIDVQHSGTEQLAALPMPLLQQLIGSLLVALPSITGMSSICTPEQFPPFETGIAQPYSCLAIQGLWSLGFLLLSGIALLLSIPTLWNYWRQFRRAKETVTREDRQQAALQWNRLILLMGALLTLAAYTISPAAALFPGPTSRYLICLQIAFPAILWPLWNGIQTLRSPDKRASVTTTQPVKKGLFFLRVALLLVVAATFVVGTIQIVPAIAEAQAFHQQGQRLVQHLESVGATRIYSDYWTCNRIIFQSNERILCAVLTDRLRRGQDRYKLYPQAVRSDPKAAYVFAADPSTGVPYETGVVQDANFNNTILSQGKVRFKKHVFEGYSIYQVQSAP